MKHFAKLLALLLAVVMVIGMLPTVAFAEESKGNSWERIYAYQDKVFKAKRSANSEITYEDYCRIAGDLAKEVMASDDYVEGSCTYEPGNATFFWDTKDGEAHGYSPSLSVKMNGRDLVDPDTVNVSETKSFAKRGGSPTGGAKDVYVIGPWYGSDGSFTDQYENEGQSIASATGGTYTLYSTTSATVDNVAHAIESGAVVIFDSHGVTDYDKYLSYKDGDDYVCDSVTQANTSYLTLTTDTGWTSADRANVTGTYGTYKHAYSFTSSDGDTVYCVDGTAIANHMSGNAPNNMVWMAICLGMATDGLYAPLRNKGVEVVYGYSQSVSFSGDYDWEADFWTKMKAGEDVATAFSYMTTQNGKWDYSSYSSYDTIAKARYYMCAFPNVVSSEDTYQGHRTNNPSSSTAAGASATGYGACNLQTVNSTWKLMGDPEPATVTLMAGSSQYGSTISTTTNTATTLPTASNYTGTVPTGYTLAGWTTAQINGTTNTAPTPLYTGTFTPTETTTTLYACFSKTEGTGGSQTVYTKVTASKNTKAVVNGSNYMFVGEDGGTYYAVPAGLGSEGTSHSATAVTVSNDKITYSSSLSNLVWATTIVSGEKIQAVNGSDYLSMNGSGIGTRSSYNKLFWNDNGGLYGTNNKNTSNYYCYVDGGTLKITGANTLPSSGRLYLYVESTEAAGITTYTTTVSSCSHNWQLTDSVPATCTDTGLTEYTCSICGDSYIEEIPALGHSYGSFTSNSNGTHSKTCSVCSDVVTESCTYTDTTSGTTVTHTCSVCGYSTQEQLSTYTVTYNDCGSTSSVSCVQGNSVTLPATASSVDGYTFAGWVAATIDPEQTSATLLESPYTPTGNVSLYACYSRVETGSGSTTSEVTDTITAADLTATNTTYADFSGVHKTSDAVYAGNSAKDSSGNIQLRSKNSNSGIVSTTSGGTVASVTITVGSGSNTIDIYGSNTAFTAASNLYGTNASITKIGSLTATGTVTFNDDYEYVGIRSNNGALYLSSVAITWTTGGGGGSTTYYTTNPVIESCEHTNVSSEWSYNENYHWHACNGCNAHFDEAEHSFDNDVTPPTVTEQGYTTHTCDCGYSYVDTYTDPTGYNYTVHFTVPTGVSAVADMLINSISGSNLPTAGAPEGYTFLGWVTSDYNNVTTAPATILTGNYKPTGEITLKALYTYTAGSDPTDDYAKASGLAAGDKVIIYNPANTKALSNAQSSAASYPERYRAGVSIEPVDDIITTNNTAIVWTVEYDANGYAFVDANGAYLSTPSGYSNLVLDSDCKYWTVTDANGKFHIISTESAGSSGDLRGIEYYQEKFTTHYANETNLTNNADAFGMELYVQITGTPYWTTVIAAACQHPNATLVPASAATCTVAGNSAYYYCADCGKYFTDNTYTTQTSLAAVTIPALGHTFNSATGTCSVCGATLPSYTISYYDLGDLVATVYCEQGGSATLPATASSVDGYTFAGWVTSEITTETDEEPTLKTNTYTPSDDVILYACYTRSEEGQGSGDYELVSTLEDGDYVFGAVQGTVGDDTDIGAVRGELSGTWGAYTVVTPANGAIANSDADDIYVWTLENVTGGITLQNKSTGKYLSLPTGTNSTTGVPSFSDDAATIYTSVLDGTANTFKLHYASNNTNQLACNYGTGYGYRMYASRDQATSSSGICVAIRFYKLSAGDTYYYTTAPAASSCSHDQTTLTGQVDATCTEAGYTGDYICDECGATVSQGSVIAALGHTWGSWTVTTAATCTTAGEQTHTCSVCNATETETIAATGHTDANSDDVCDVCGADLSTPAEPDYSGDYYIAAIRSSGNYQWMTNDLGSASTKRYQAEDSGLDTLPAAISSNVDSAKTWTLAKQQDGTYLLSSGGSYSTWTSGNSADLGETGIAITVTANGDAVQMTISDGARYLSLNDTAANNFFAYYGGTQINDLYLVPVNGTIAPACEHTNTTTTGAAAATCTTDGYTGDVVCSDCGAIVTAGSVIPATGHTDANSDDVCDVCGADLSTPAVTSGWYLVDDYTNLEDGIYALITPNNYAFNGTISSGHGQKTDGAFSWDANGYSATAPTGTLELTFTSTANGFTLYDETLGYLYASKASSGGLAFHASEDSGWSFSADGGLYAANGAHLRTYDDTFRTYGGNNNSTLLLAYKVVVAHTHDPQAVAAVPATCTTAGTTAGTVCSICGEILSGCEEIAALGHDWVAGTVVAATCTEAGYTPYTCSRCSETKQEAIPATGHTDANSDDVCDVCGADLSTPAGDDFSGDYYIAASRTTGNYFWMTNDLGTANKKRYQAEDSGLDTLPAAITENVDAAKTWTLAKQQDGTYLLSSGGSYSTWTSDNSADLGETGVAITVAAIENNAVTMTIEEGARYLSLNNTTGNNYFAYYSGTGQVEELHLVPVTGEVPTPATHTATYFAGQAATCTEAGVSAYWYCEDCLEDPTGEHYGKCYSDEGLTTEIADPTIPALGHILVAGTVHAPTCTEEGYTEYACSRCEYTTIDDIVAATGHTWVAADPSDSENYVAATCTSTGLYYDLCSVCGAQGELHEIAATEHTPVYTSNGNGTHDATCSVCNTLVVDNEACTYSGGVCTLCGAHEPVAETPDILTAALVLNGKIDVAYTVKVPDGYTAPYMVFNGPNGAMTVRDYVISGNNYVFTYTGINPQCMGDNISATLYATSDETVTSYDVEPTYSVRQYCVNKLADSTISTSLRTLLSDMLAYGAAAQTYMGYETGALVTAGEINNPTYSTFENLSGLGASFEGTANAEYCWISAGLTLTDSVAMTFRFYAADTSELTVTVAINGRTKEFTEFTAVNGLDNVYEISFAGISAEEFGSAVTASFSGSRGNSVSYSVNAYVQSKQADTVTANLAALVQALYNYGAAAAAYANPANAG